MKQLLFSAILYLFKKFEINDVVEANKEAGTITIDRTDMDDADVENIHNWLQILIDHMGKLEQFNLNESTRVYTRTEIQRIDVKCRGFLLFLEQNGILSTLAREVVIHQAMLLDEELTLEEAKWLVPLILNSQNDEIFYHNMLDVDEIYDTVH